MIDLTELIRAVIALMTVIITSVLIPWIRAKTTNEQRKKMKDIYRMAVFAAEQLWGAGNGEAKLKDAQHMIEEAGYTFDRALLEATVCECLNLTFEEAYEFETDDGDEDSEVTSDDE